MTNDIEGFILAGGANSRMGSRKAALKLDGRTFVQIARSSLDEITNKIRIVGEKEDSIADDGLEWVPDMFYKEKSSLLGLATALTNCKMPCAFVLACDLPFVTGDLVERIASFCSRDADAVVPVQPDGRLQPLCALYRRDACLEKAMEMLKTGKRSLHSLVRYLNPRLVEFSEISDLADSDLFFTNINTPADFEVLQDIISRVASD